MYSLRKTTQVALSVISYADAITTPIGDPVQLFRDPGELHPDRRQSFTFELFSLTKQSSLHSTSITMQVFRPS